MKLKEGLDLVDLIEKMDEVIDHEGDESPMVKIFNSIPLIKSGDKESVKVGEETIYWEMKKYQKLLKKYTKEIK